MKKTLGNKFITTALFLMGFVVTSVAQSSVAATATATIVAPISISKNADMSFGNIAVQSGTGGTVVLAPAGTRSRTDGVTLPATTGTVTAAAFTVDGSGSYAYSVTMPGSVTLTRASGSETMAATSFTNNLASGTGALVSGTQDFAVGATLTVAAAQVPGIYTSGNFNVTVNYN